MSIYGFLLCVGVSNVMVAAATDCSSESCILITSRIEQNMDPSVNYCNDFYKFACGRFVQSTRIPEGQQSISNDEMLLSELNESIKTMITAEIADSEPEPFKILKRLYKSCRNLPMNMRQQHEDLKKFLKEKGGWPALEGVSWKDTHFNWRQKLQKFRVDGDSIGDFIGLRIDEDPKNKSSRIVTLFQPHGFFTPKISETDFNNPFVEAYYKTLVDIAVALGANETYALVHLKETILFEMKLANIKLTDEKIAGLNSFNPMTIKELNETYPTVPWIENIEAILSSPDFEISVNETINVPVPEYYVKLENLIAETIPRVRANYVMSKIALRNGIYSSEKIRKILYGFMSTILNKTEDSTREKFCIDQVVGNLWLIFSTMFLEKYSPSSTVNRVDQIRNSVKKEFTKTVDQITYLDDKSKRSMIMEADRIKNVSYPNNTESLQKYYKNLVINESNFFENMHELSIFDTHLTWTEWRYPESKTDSLLTFEATSINPAIFATHKYIPISKKLLQILYVSDYQPSYIGFSTIATTAARDIIDALYNNGDTKKTCDCDECIIEKYENHSTGDTGLKLNGKRTLSENRADIGRLRLAYDAYNTWTATGNDSLKLPGFEEYTAKQMFWISAASSICTKYTNEGMNCEINNSFQVPAEFRVNIAFANMPEFAKDFGCSPLSPMKAKTTCSIW